MSEFWGCGAMLRARGCVLLAIPLMVSLLPFGTPAIAKSRTNNYTGELNYATFRKAAARNESVTIRYSPGGTGASAMALARVRNVVIDGTCNSACAWSFVKNANACFTPRASFGFHAAHDPGTGRRMNAATSYWLQSVRPSLRGRLQPLLSSSSVIRVTAADMRRHYGERSCDARKNMVEAPTSRQKKMHASAAPADHSVAARVIAPAPAVREAEEGGKTSIGVAMLSSLETPTLALDMQMSVAAASEPRVAAFYFSTAAPDVLAEAFEAAYAQRQISSALVTTGAIVAQGHAEFANVCEFAAGEAVRAIYTMTEISLP